MMRGAMHSLLFAITVICTCAAGFAQAQDAPQERRLPSTPVQFNWARTSPLAFLTTLKDNSASVMFIADRERPPKDWIKEEHVRRLMRFIDSDQPAAPVVSQASPFLPPSRSTVGVEAMYLIEGYRTGRYPPTLCSVYDFKPNPDGYRTWWRDRLKEENWSTTAVGAVSTADTSPTRDDIVADSKTRDLSVIDDLLLRKDTFTMGSAQVDVLVNRITGAVEYVWAPPYQRYARPKFVMPNAQDLFNSNR